MALRLLYDAKELSHRANRARTAQLGNIEKLIENAVYDNSALNVDHDKFTDFHYYAVSVKYEGEVLDLWLNIGVAKNDGKNHLYAITNQSDKIKEKNRPPITAWSRPVGNAIQNDSSNTSIPQNSEKSIGAAEKVFEKGEKVSTKSTKATRRSLDEDFDTDTFFANALENGGIISHEEAEAMRSEKTKSQTSRRSEKKVTSYTKKNAAELVDQIFAEHMLFEDGRGKLAIGGKGGAIKVAHGLLNSADPGKRNAAALKFADYILARTVISDDTYYSDLTPYIDTVELLKPYIRKLRLDGIKDEIKYHYDKNRGPYLRWGAKNRDAEVWGVTNSNVARALSVLYHT